MYIFLHARDSGNVINLIVSIFVHCSNENNVFDWEEYTKAWKGDKTGWPLASDIEIPVHSRAFFQYIF